MNVYVVKVVDGTEIIGKIEDERRRAVDIVRIHEPLEIRYRESPLGGATAVLVKYNYFGSEASIDVFTSAVICVYRASDEYSRTYEESLKTIAEQVGAKKKTGFEGKKSSEMREAVEELIESLISTDGKGTIH